LKLVGLVAIHCGDYDLGLPERGLEGGFLARTYIERRDFEDHRRAFLDPMVRLAPV